MSSGNRRPERAGGISPRILEDSLLWLPGIKSIRLGNTMSKIKIEEKSKNIGVVGFSMFRILFCTILGLFFSACLISPTPPSPEIVPGIYLQSGYEFYHWKEGLRLMIWHDGSKTSGCESSTNNQKFILQCYAQSDDYRVDWYVETTDGESAQFSINAQPYNLADGTLFIITNSGEDTNVKQLKRDLSKVAANTEAVIEFGLADPVVWDFIQSSSKLVDCISFSYSSQGDTTEADIADARNALIDFFSYLKAGEYELASDLYGGSYSVMQDHNPDVDSDDHAALFRNACLINGAQCLEIRKATLSDQPSAYEFRFVVEFSNDDGSLFTRTPCCGENSIDAQIQTEFIYTTRLDCMGKYHILEMPVYLP